jgi:hypothetical protein
MNEVIWYMSFCAWNISLNIMITNSVHVAENDRSFPFYEWMVSHCIHIYQIFSISSSVDKCLGWSHNKCDSVNVSLICWFHFLWIMGILDHMVFQFFMFWGTIILFSIVAELVWIPTNCVQGLSFSMSLLPFIIFGLFHYRHSNWSAMISHCGSAFQFPDD